MKTNKLILTGLFTAISAIAAQISIPLPFSPVPLTLQVLAVCLAGATLGAKWGAVSQLVYVLLGAFGVPVFSQYRAGLGIILGPTGGYITGFIIGAFLIGLLVEKSNNSYLQVMLAMAAGLAVIYVAGTLQLAFLLKLGWQQALIMGVGWFLPLDMVKVLIGARLSVAVRGALFSAGKLSGAAN
ncbi:MAG: biotin transporter BioY [Halanaerobium sp.]|nr:biotin transporter BioY [Halanaerobium sp.]